MSLSNFKTARLTVSHWRTSLSNPRELSNLEHRLQSLLTETVLRHLPEPLHRGHGKDWITDWIKERDAEADVALIRSRDNGDLVGLLILAEFEDQDGRTIHIGYLFGEPHWGKGFASELIGGLVLAAQAESPLTLVGGVEVKNIASAKVLTKSGFVPTAEADGTTTYSLRLSSGDSA